MPILKDRNIHPDCPPQNISQYKERESHWRVGIERVGIEREPDFGPIDTARSPFGLIQRMLKLESPPADFLPEIPGDLWGSGGFNQVRQQLIDVHAVADACARRQPYHTTVFRRAEGGDMRRENAHISGLRASYFALRYLGVTDPVVHALIRLSDPQAGVRGTGRRLHDSRYIKNVCKDPAIAKLISSRVLPRDFLGLLSSLDSDQERWQQASDEVARDPAVRLGVSHSPESLWDLFRHATMYHTSDSGHPNRFQSPSTLYAPPRQDLGGVSLGEYQTFLAHLSLTYSRITHPQEDSPEEVQKGALPFLMETLPKARGLNEHTLGRVAGDCVFRAFMPKEYAALGDVVESVFPQDTLIQERDAYAEWFEDYLRGVIPDARYVTPYELLRHEYRTLRGMESRFGALDVAIPGIIGSKNVSGVSVIDTKTRSGVFLKMIEIWNDRGSGGKWHRLPDQVKDMRWGSHDFWHWVITHQHDIFRTQLILLGDRYNTEYCQAVGDRLRHVVSGDDNYAQCMFPAHQEDEIFEEKSGRGFWVNGIYRGANPARVNCEIQIRNLTAHEWMTTDASPAHHSVYKLRHQIGWATAQDSDDRRLQKVNEIAEGARRLRIAHLAATYGFEDGDQDPHMSRYARGGNIFRSRP